jgi:hypothetical protein
MPHRQRLAPARTGLAGWAALLALAVACGRTGLDRAERGGRATGSGGANLGGSTTGAGGSQLGGTTGSGGSNLGGSTIGSGGMGLGGTTGFGGTGAGGATSDAGCATAPAPFCVRGPDAATVLGAYDDAWNIVGITSSGEQLFIATSNSDSTWLRGRIVRIWLRTLATKTYDVEGSPSGLGYQAQAVSYRPTFCNPSDPFDFYAPTVVRWDLQTDAVANLPNPPDFPSSDGGPLAANAKGEIFWSMRQNARTAIARWDPCTGQTDVLVADHDAVELFADDEGVYWQEPKGGRGTAFAGHTYLYTLLTTKGATASVRVDAVMYSWNGPGLLAIDDQRLYYLADMEPERGVQAIPKRGAAGPTSVIPDADPLRLDSSTIDDAHIYWVGLDDQDTLRRTPKRGGTTESVWTGKGRPIQAVTVDACNVYWIATNPPAIYYRAK